MSGIGTFMYIYIYIFFDIDDSTLVYRGDTFTCLQTMMQGSKSCSLFFSFFFSRKITLILRNHTGDIFPTRNTPEP